jgi:rhodanese-related sulfurtransferase
MNVIRPVLAAALLLSMPALFAEKMSKAQQATSTKSTATTNPAADFTMMDAAAVNAAIDAKQTLFVFDANSKASYESRHVPGSTWVVYNKLKAEQLPAAKDAKLVFYCANEMCPASHMAAKQAMAMGYTDVNVMPQGIQGWVKAGYRTDALKM